MKSVNLKLVHEYITKNKQEKNNKRSSYFLPHSRRAFYTSEQHILYGICVVVTSQISGSYNTTDD